MAKASLVAKFFFKCPPERIILYELFLVELLSGHEHMFVWFSQHRSWARQLLGFLWGGACVEAMPKQLKQLLDHPNLAQQYAEAFACEPRLKTVTS